MSDAYKNVKAGRLVFKGGYVAGADKKKRKKKKKVEADAEENPFDAAATRRPSPLHHLAYKNAMSDAYKNVKAGRLVFKGGDVAGADKKKRKKKKKVEVDAEENPFNAAGEADGEEATKAGAKVYTIDAAKRMKYEELFPVESKKFGYDSANKSRTSARTAEEVLDDRVKKKADRYCK